MKFKLYNFQLDAVNRIRKEADRNTRAYLSDYEHDRNYVISLQAPTGAGKTIIISAFIESVYDGLTIIDPNSNKPPRIYEKMSDAIFVWLSDSPALNAQSRSKIDHQADKVRYDQCKIIDDSFDKQELEDGHIYFLNTQKLSVAGRLSQHSDGRTYTIWQTLDNTARNKADRLYFIIDEAHRGMQGAEASKANSIMQKFIKGSPENGMRPMPVIIGMSATSSRFDRLVDKCPNSSLFKVKVETSDVRISGLLKERIVVTYPDDATKFNETAVLQAATEEWIDKCKHWYQYTVSQHYANVDPVFVIQVDKGKGKQVSKTDLDNLLKTIEDTQGEKFKEHEVVHTFGSIGDIEINGLLVHHIAPEDIADDHDVKVVLFKEALSTGWDCPRAEAMVSFSAAEDPTYIAQLLGRMIRTPRGSRVRDDETLNEVRMYLPFFNRENVKAVINELKSNEGEDIPADVDEEPMGQPTYRPYTANRKEANNPGQQNLWDSAPDSSQPHPQSKPEPEHGENRLPGTPESETKPSPTPFPSPTPSSDSSPKMPTVSPSPAPSPDKPAPQKAKPDQIPLMPEINRKEILDFINGKGYLSYVVNTVRTRDYLTSLLDISSLLTTWNIYREANDDVTKEVTDMIHEYAEDLRVNNVYAGLKDDVKQMKLSIQVYDIFGEEIKNGNTSELFMTDKFIDTEAEHANSRMGKRNFVGVYVNRFQVEDGMDAQDCKIDCILFAKEDKNIEKLHDYAKKKFYYLDEKYRRKITNKSTDLQSKYKKITAAASDVSETFLSLPERISNPVQANGQTYYKHLYVDEETGQAKINLTHWEPLTIAEESNHSDFVCWIRNPAKTSWALTIPYKMDGKVKPMYPDFIIVRSDQDDKYCVDILEPHGDHLIDSLSKAKGMAEYAEREDRMGRIQMLRVIKDPVTKKERIQRLDFYNNDTREKIKNAVSADDFLQVFKEKGFFED